MESTTRHGETGATSEDQVLLPAKGIKRKILEVLAVLGRGSKSEDLRSALGYRGRNWRYFMSDLVDRGLVTRTDDPATDAAYEIADGELRGDVIERITETERVGLERILSDLEDGNEVPDARQEEPESAPTEPPAPQDSADSAGPVEAERSDSESTDPRPIEAASPPSAGNGGDETPRKARGRKDRRRSRSGDESGEDLLRLAEDALRRGDNDSAASLARDGIDGKYEGAGEGSDLDPLFRIRAAQALIRALRLGEARALLDPLTVEDQAPKTRDSALAHIVAAECYLASGETERSRELMVKADAYTGEPSREHAMRKAFLEAKLALMGGRPSEALRRLDTLNQAPDDPADRARLSLLRGGALLTLGEFERAVSPLQEALDIDRNRGNTEEEREAALFLGRAFHCRAQFAKSDSFLERATALAKGTRDEDARVGLALARATVYADRGDEARLESALESLPQKVRKENTRSCMQEARLLFLKGRIGDAAEALEKLTETQLGDSDAADALRELGVCYRNLGHREAAIAPLEESLRRAERARDRVSIARSRVEYALGLLDHPDPAKRSGAVVGVKKALRLLEYLEVPDLVWRGYHALGLIFLEEGRYEDAFVRLGDATTILDQLLGRFQDRKSREAFLRDRFEPYRDRVAAFIGARPYDSPLDRLRRATYREFIEFLRKNADADSDTGPRYNEIGRLSASVFELYEDTALASIEDVEQSNEASDRIRKLVAIVGKDDAAALSGELLSAGITLVRARMGAIGLVDSERSGAFDYFKGRNLPGRDKAKTEPIRKLVRDVAASDQEVSIDGRDRIEGPGEACAIGMPLPKIDRYSGAMILWFPKGQRPANHELEILRLTVAAVAPSIGREFRFRALRLRSHKAEQELKASLQDARETLDEARELRDSSSTKDEARCEPGFGDDQDALLGELFRGELSYKGFMEAIEQNALEEGLRFYRGDIGAMAKGLRFSGSNLRKKLGRFDLIDES